MIHQFGHAVSEQAPPGGFIAITIAAIGHSIAAAVSSPVMSLPLPFEAPPPIHHIITTTVSSSL